MTRMREQRPGGASGQRGGAEEEPKGQAQLSPGQEFGRRDPPRPIGAIIVGDLA